METFAWTGLWIVDWGSDWRICWEWELEEAGKQTGSVVWITGRGVHTHRYHKNDRINGAFGGLQCTTSVQGNRRRYFPQIFTKDKPYQSNPACGILRADLASEMNTNASWDTDISVLSLTLILTGFVKTIDIRGVSSSFISHRYWRSSVWLSFFGLF